LRTKIVDTLATFFYCGFLPLFPGTWASFFTLFIAFYCLNNFKSWAYLLLLVLVILIGIPAAGQYDLIHKTQDAGQIVIDEVAGQLLALLPLAFLSVSRYNLSYYLLAFILFRFFDISKILGINLLQRLPGGVGVVMDDILAGVYTAICLGVSLWIGF
jgi:phosphatidylglycerophosphatase A